MELSPSVGGPIRLQLGGTGDGQKKRILPGWTNCDLRGDADVVCDCSKLDFFESGTVDEVYASHILEHWPHGKTLDVLKEWCRVIKPGGRLYVAVPDFSACVELYSKIGLTDFVRNLMYGDQEYELAYHYTIFTFPTLAALCVKAGFSDVKKVRVFKFGLEDCSSLIDTVFGKPISLNVEAQK